MRTRGEFFNQRDIKNRYSKYLRYDQFMYEIAMEIDYKIVRGFIKNRDALKGSQIRRWDIRGTGLVYQFKENNQRHNVSNSNPHDSSRSDVATENQIKYIANLMRGKKNVSITIEMKDITKTQAGALIGYLKFGAISENHRNLVLET